MNQPARSVPKEPLKGATTGTLLGLLRAGDDIVFNVRYNGNQYSEIVGLNRHELILRIKRFNKSGETINKIRQVVFDSQCCPTNSALHMKDGVKILPYNREFDTKYKIAQRTTKAPYRRALCWYYQTMR